MSPKEIATSITEKTTVSIPVLVLLMALAAWLFATQGRASAADDKATQAISQNADKDTGHATTDKRLALLEKAVVSLEKIAQTMQEHTANEAAKKQTK